MGIRRVSWAGVVAIAGWTVASGGDAVVANDEVLVADGGKEAGEQLEEFRGIVEDALNGKFVDIVVGDVVAVPAPAVEAPVAVDDGRGSTPEAPAVNPGDANPEFEARLAPFKAMLEPLLKSELSFANRICHWSDEQRKEAIVAGKA